MRKLLRTWRKRNNFKKLLKGRSQKQRKRLIALKNFANGQIYEPLTPTAIKTFLKPNINLSQEDLSEIKIMRFATISRSYGRDKLENIYCDAPWNFVLTYRDEAIASIGFSCGPYDEKNDFFHELNNFSFWIQKMMSGYKVLDHPWLKIGQYPPDSITIVQIQGAKCFGFHKDGKEGAMKILSLIRWEKLLINIVKNWAFNNGFNEVRVVSAHKNRWYTMFRNNAEKIASWETRMKIRYNTTPKRMGFKKSPKGGYWFLQKDPSI